MSGSQQLRLPDDVRLLGEGSQASVLLVQGVAIKCIPSTVDDMAFLSREVNIVRDLKHPCIIR